MFIRDYNYVLNLLCPLIFLSRRSSVPQRIKKIIALVENEKDQGEVSSKSETQEVLVKELYAREYSMTSSVFNTFCETQISYNSYHASNLPNNLNRLKKAFPETQIDSHLEPASPTSLKPGLRTSPQARPCTSLQAGLNTSPQPSPSTSSQPGPLTSPKQGPSTSAHPGASTSPQPNPSTKPPPGPSMSPQPGPSTSVQPAPHNISELLCFESMPLSNRYLSPVDYDFDSDDSVMDKDYKPNDDSSDDTSDDEQNNPTVTNTKSSKVQTINVDSIFPIRKPLKQRRHSLETMRHEIQNSISKKRRSTFDSVGIQPSNDKNENTLDDPAKKRKRFNTSLKQRELEKKQLKQSQFNVKAGCNDKCIKKCSTQFSSEERDATNKAYQNLNHAKKRLFIRENYSVAIPKRKYTTEPRRNPKRTFTLQKSDGTKVSVCKNFFLTTLGYNKSNDGILNHSLNPQNDLDKRGKHTKVPGFDRHLLSEHIESFQPCAPHYRREHAPNRRYLPSEINIKFMHKDFCSKFPENKVSYELYRAHLKLLNISFARLGNEECEVCESYKLHSKDTNHDVEKQFVLDCDICTEWSKHHERYKKARMLYDSHKNIEQNEEHIHFSSDLEKVIMLPRLDTFKAVIFCPRLTAFNQTFAPVGKITKNYKPLAVIWHDGIAGRKQQDIISAYYTFFIRYRDVKHINVWMDNCTSQNKNWLLFSFLVQLINSDVTATETITLYYFEPGHTFMSCDQFHHQVELSMKKKGKIYDFHDFEEAVSSANNGRVFVKALQAVDFIDLPNIVSNRRIQTCSPRVYLRNITEICFIRSSYDLQYKNDFSEAYQSLKFLKDKYLKNPQLGWLFKTQPKGIEKERKLNILQKLSSIIPKHKQLFWQNLPSSE